MSIANFLYRIREKFEVYMATRREKRKQKSASPKVSKRMQAETLLMKQNGMTYSTLSESNRAWLDSRISDMVSER